MEHPMATENAIEGAGVVSAYLTVSISGLEITCLLIP